jgi:putative ABC transport system substrate-binding protein
MRRRAFIGLVGGAVVWPLAARSEQRIARIGYLTPATADANEALFEEFEAGLAQLGYVPGKTVEIAPRFADGHEDRLTPLARELVDLKVDVIVTYGFGVFWAHEATLRVPIVAASVYDPVAMGLADSLAHPGGNVTGQTFFYSELIVKRIELLKQVRPAMTSVGLLLGKGMSLTAPAFSGVWPTAKKLGISIVPISLLELSDLDSVLSADPAASIGGLVVTDDAIFGVSSEAAEIAAAAMRRGLPGAGGLEYARNGFLLGEGVDYNPMFRRAAVFVDKILKGSKPGDIPIEQATRFTTIVNLKTAKALGIDIPPAVLAAADEVIE